jgi:anti-anti-sigma factor
MPVKQTLSNDGKIMHLSVSGRFDYKISKEFRESYKQTVDHKDITYYVNLSDTSYMDSSALGILLLLREYAKENNGRVVIEQPGEMVNHILQVANFGKLFTINQTRSKPDLVIVKTST